MEARQDKRTMAELARSAVDVQNACNLTGVICEWHAVSKRLHDLLWEEGNHGTDYRNAHPINVAYADKVASLTGIQFNGLDVAIAAHNACDELATG